MPSFREIMARAQMEVPQVSVEQVYQALQRDGNFRLIDVRELHEFEQGHILGAVHVPRGFLEMRIEDAAPDKNERLVLY